MNQFPEILIKILHYAQKAGDILMKYYNNGDMQLGLNKKHAGELVTDADLDSNAFIVSNLNKTFPDIPILSEEGDDNLDRLQSAKLFIVDPLDGTNNFIMGYDDFSVSIAYTEGMLEKHLPIYGVVYKPITGESYFAQRKMGSFLMKGDVIQPLIISKCNKLKNARLVCSALRKDILTTRLKKAHSLWIGKGSSALMISMIAEGKAEWYAHVADRYLSEYDVCAADLILSEAGGLVTDLQGKKIYYNKSNVKLKNGLLASIKPLYDDVCQIISDNVLID